MAGSIEETLRELDTWYNELPSGTERPLLLSKLAILELCGWIEEHSDGLVERVGLNYGLDPIWIQENVLRRINGFSYSIHLRPMIVNLIGEFGVKTFEASFEKANPGMIDQLKSELGDLWKTRIHLAHTNSAAPVKQQVTINAPSWSRNRQRVLAKTLDAFEKELITALKITLSVQ